MHFLQYHNLISCSQSSFPAFSRINQTPNKSWRELYYAGKPLFQKNVFFYLSFLSWDTEHNFCMIPSPTLLFVLCVCVFFFYQIVFTSLLQWECRSSWFMCELHKLFQKCLFLRHLFISLIRNSFKMINFISLLVPLSSCQSPSRFMKGRGRSVLSKYHKKKGKRENIIYISAFNHI